MRFYTKSNSPILKCLTLERNWLQLGFILSNFAIHDNPVGPEGAIVLNSGLKNIYIHLLYKAHSRF